MAVTAPTQEFKNPIACATAFGRILSAVDSTVYFSQVLVTAKDAGICYQLNDPISEDLPDVLDTDGGYILLDDAINIQSIVPFRSGVAVFADNGVWYIYNPDGGFKATSFNVTKVTERGLDSKRSVVEAEGNLFYLSGSGIIRIYADEFDNLRGEDITELNVRGYVVEFFIGKGSQGEYNESDKQIIWWNPDDDSRGLILDLTVNAFYPQQNAGDAKIAKLFTIQDSVYYPYWTVGGTPTTTTYSIAQPTNESFQDFGEDINAYLISGWETLGKFANKKSVTQAKVFFNKTETTITGYNDGYLFDKPSSCLFQSRWDFDNSNAYSKWVGVVDGTGSGYAMQLYNPLQRGFVADAYPYDFDTGESVITKKFNIRGNGDAVQFLFKAEPEKDMQLLGYSVSFTMRGRI
jgi:hypothetical protein